MFLKIELSFIQCLIFGALISPTDPIAVLSILRSAKVSKALETKISGESLFNDGVAVVLFTVVLGIAYQDHHIHWLSISKLLIVETLGGALLGTVAGYIAYLMLEKIDDYVTEIMITLALVFTGGTIAEIFHLSGPIAAVCAGLLIGNRGRSLAMSSKTVEQLDTFWHLLDEIFNSILFVLLGLEVFVITFTGEHFIAGILAIPIVLLARGTGVWAIITALKSHREFSSNTIKILTWGGLRGGISIALALSLPRSEVRDVIIAMTFIVVVFSVLVQGLTVKYLVK